MSEHQTLEAGESIGDGYVVESLLGGGGMGEVYVARDTRLDRQVAVKVLHEDLGLDSEADARFQREAQVMSRVVHPNVVAVYGFGRHGASWYIAMELVEGESLEELLDRSDTLSLEETITIARQIAGGLSEAHAHGIVHRDIKPGNILLRRLASGALLTKVVDFGLARAFEDRGDSSDSVTDRAKIMGTPPYMAPEQIQQAPLDGRTDLYALAVVVFQMLTGDLPIFRKTVQGILLAHLVDEPARLDVPAAGRVVSRALDKVVRKSLAKDAADRFDGVVAFAEALERASGLAVGATAAAVACPSCGHFGREGAAFCERCGSAVPLSACPACATERRGERYFCQTCGTSLLNPSRQLAADGPATTDRGHNEQITAAVLVAHIDGDLSSAAARDLAQSFAPHVEREGGRPLALLGRECTAAFGLGGMREREMESAIDAAIALQRQFERLRGIDPGCGLQVGMALGRVETRGLGFAWGTAFAGGPAVEQARFAAATAADGEVLVTDAALREVRGTYATQPASAGLTRILRHRDVSTTFSAPRHGLLHGAFVARDADVETMLQAAKQCRHKGVLHAIPVIGEGGAGKSRLVGEFLAKLADGDSDWQVDAARCSAVGLPVAYEPFVEILRTRALADDSSSDAVRARLAALPGLSGIPGDRTTEDRVESLGRLMGLTAQQTLELHDARPATAAEQVAAFDAFSAFLRGVCEQRPLVMVLADLQWAKPTTMDLLAHVVKTCSDLPVLLVMPMRTPRSEDILTQAGLPLTRTRTIELAPLTAEQSAEMVRALLGGADLPDTLTERIHAFAQGTPARVHEAVEALTEQGVIRATDLGWEVDPTRSASATLDRSLSEVVLSRIGRLPPAERSILQAIALAGVYAPTGMIRAILERNVADEELDALVRTGFLREEPHPHFAGEREHVHRQRAVAAIIAESITGAHLEESHRQAARWLMEWTGARPAGFGAMLAHHFLVAGDDRNAAQFLVKTARDALRAFANRDAYDAFTAAAEVGEHSDASDATALNTRLEALLGQAEVGFHLGELEAALQAAEKAEDLATEENEAHTIIRSRAFIVQGEVLTRFGDYHDAITAFGFATRATDAGPRGQGLAAIATGRRALVLYRAGESDEAQACARAGLTEYARAVPTSDVLNGLGRLHTVLGHVASRAGDFDAAEAQYQQASDHHERAGDTVGAAMATLSVGGAAYRAGNLGRAETLFADAAQSCASIDYLQGECNARINLGTVLLDQERPGEALAELITAEHKMRASGLRDMMPETLRLIAVARMARGNSSAASEAATEALAIARELDSTSDVDSILAVLRQARAAQASDPTKTTIIE